MTERQIRDISGLFINLETMPEQGKINFALGQTKTAMSESESEEGTTLNLRGLRMLPFAIPWLITFSLIQSDSLLTGTLQLCRSQTFKSACAEKTENEGRTAHLTF